VVDVQVLRAAPSDVATIEHIVHEAFGNYVARIGRQPAPITADYRTAVAVAPSAQGHGYGAPLLTQAGLVRRRLWVVG
jgi:GNAT superfamily N-acetyltransferase